MNTPVHARTHTDSVSVTSLSAKVISSSSVLLWWNAVALCQVSSYLVTATDLITGRTVSKIVSSGGDVMFYELVVDHPQPCHEHSVTVIPLTIDVAGSSKSDNIVVVFPSGMH